MKKVLFIGILVAVFSLDAIARDDVDIEKEKAAIKQAALDYVDGAYAGEADRVDKALHPGLQKVVVGKLGNGRELFSFMGKGQLVEGTKVGFIKRPPEERNIEVTIYLVYKNIAAVKISSAMFIDYAHIARINGEWRVVSVLWAMQNPPPQSVTEEDKAAIVQAGLDYVDGYFEGSGERNEKGVHPSLHKAVVRQLPNGREFLYRIDRHTLIEITSSGMGKLPAEERNVSVEIFDTLGNIATIKVPSAKFMDCAHVAKINGEWKIINVLWAPK